MLLKIQRCDDETSKGEFYLHVTSEVTTVYL